MFWEAGRTPLPNFCGSTPPGHSTNHSIQRVNILISVSELDKILPAEFGRTNCNSRFSSAQNRRINWKIPRINKPSVKFFPAETAMCSMYFDNEKECRKINEIRASLLRLFGSVAFVLSTLEPLHTEIS